MGTSQASSGGYSQVSFGANQVRGLVNSFGRSQFRGSSVTPCTCVKAVLTSVRASL